MKLRVALLVLLACCGKPPLTQVPVPDQENRAEVRTAEAGWQARLADLTACVLRTDRAGDCGGTPEPPVCDTRSKAEVLRSVQPILDSIPRVMLTSSFAMNRDLRALFPSATPTSEVLDARRKTSCRDWSGGACAAIRTTGIAVVFEGTPGAAPERILIFRVAPVCRQDRPDQGGGA